MPDDRPLVLDAPDPPPPRLHPAMCAKLLAAARSAPGGWICRGRWVAVTGLREPWTTAMVRLEGVPDEAVFETTRFAAYARTLHALLVRAYADQGLGLPPWRAWNAILRRWPVLAADGAAGGARVHALRPLPDTTVGRTGGGPGTRPIPIPAARRVWA